MYDVSPTLANHLRKNPAMNSLTDNLAFRISKVNIVSGKNKRYLTSGNFVTTMKLPNSSSFSSSSSSSSSLSSSSSAAKLVRRRTYAPTGFSAERDQKQKQQPSSLMAASDPDAKVDRIAGIASAIRVIPNFPKPGVMFQDITTLLLDPKAFKDTIDLLVERYRGKGISVVAGIEARGFIFGPPIALAIGAKFVPMRKPNKLPGEVISEEYSLEYGTDKIEMHVGAVQAGECALVVDDLIATGGTLCAAIRLLERVGVHVVECACIIELPDLKGRERLGDKPLFVLVSSV